MVSGGLTVCCPCFSAWCLKNEHVHNVILGASTVEQLYEDIQALQVGVVLGCVHSGFTLERCSVNLLSLEI